MNLKSDIFWLKNRLIRHKAIKQYNEAINSLSIGTEKLKELNWDKRREIVNYAYHNIPFYKDFYDSHNFKPSSLKTEKDWEKVPVLPKKLVRENIEKIKNPHVKEKYIGVATTGGSTGLPLKIYTDKRYNWEVLGWRMFKQWGISPADNVGIIHRRVPTTFWRKLKNRALWWPTKRVYLNASSMNLEEIKCFVNDIIKKNIVWLQGYVGGLEKIADYINSNNIKITTLQLVWSTSAPLMDNVRLKMEKAFNCKIMNQYGSNEFPNIAMQCKESDNLHINYDSVHIDILSEGKYVIDKEGEILVTCFKNKVFPLIKYEIGDKGTILSESCKCRNPLPILRKIKGRTSDSVYTPSGRYIDGNYLNSIFDDYATLFDQFQVYQSKNYSLDIRVKIYNNDYETKEALNKIKGTLETKVNHEIPVTISIVNHIDDDKGKIRYIISEIALDKINK